MIIFINMGYVYLIQEGEKNTYKIGVTKNNVELGRLKNLQTGNSDELTVINTFKCEHYFKLEGFLHRRFNSNNKRGEFFNLTDDEVLNFTKTCKNYNEIIEYLIKTNPFYK